MGLVLGLSLGYGWKGRFHAFLFLVAEQVDYAAFVLADGVVVVGLAIQQIDARPLSIILSWLLLIDEGIILVLFGAVNSINSLILDFQVTFERFVLHHLVGLPIGVLVELFIAVSAVEAAGRFVLGLFVVEIEDSASWAAFDWADELFELWYFIVDLGCEGAFLFFLGWPLLLQEVYCCHYVKNFTQHLALFRILLGLVLFFECFLIAPVLIILTFHRPDSFQLPNFLSSRPIPIFPMFLAEMHANFIAILGDAMKLMLKSLPNASIDMPKWIKLTKLKQLKLVNFLGVPLATDNSVFVVAEFDHLWKLSVIFITLLLSFHIF